MKGETLGGKGHEGFLGTDGNVLYPDCGDSYTGIYICHNASNYTLK